MKIPLNIVRLEGMVFLRSRQEELLAALEEGPIGILRYTEEVAMVLVSREDWEALHERPLDSNEAKRV